MRRPSSPMPDPLIRLLGISELDDPGARGCQVGGGDWPLELLLVRRGRSVFGYVNRCPHAGYPLNWLPDRFLSRDGSLIQCASHGARFELQTGLCVAGPCVGRSLRRVPLEVSSAGIFIARQTVAALRPWVAEHSTD